MFKNGGIDMSKLDFKKDYPYLSEIKGCEKIISAMGNEYSKNWTKQ